METRSQSQSQLQINQIDLGNHMETTVKKEATYKEVNIDFDEASIAWRKNKRVLRNGMFSYTK